MNELKIRERERERDFYKERSKGLIAPKEEVGI